MVNRKSQSSCMLVIWCSRWRFAVGQGGPGPIPFGLIGFPRAPAPARKANAGEHYTCQCIRPALKICLPPCVACVRLLLSKLPTKLVAISRQQTRWAPSCLWWHRKGDLGDLSFVTAVLPRGTFQEIRCGIWTVEGAVCPQCLPRLASP